MRHHIFMLKSLYIDNFRVKFRYRTYRLQCPQWDHHKIGTIADLALYPIFLLIRTPSHMSECWHYIRFGTISDGTVTGMHCIVIQHIFRIYGNWFLWNMSVPKLGGVQKLRAPALPQNDGVWFGKEKGNCGQKPPTHINDLFISGSRPWTSCSSSPLLSTYML